MQRLLLSIAAAGMVSAAMAIPAKPGLIKYTQPDGTEIEIRMVGDEHGHVAYSSDGFLLINSGEALEYAKFDEFGTPQASGILATNQKLNSELAEKLQPEKSVENWRSQLMSRRVQSIMKSRKAEDVDSGDPGSQDPIIPQNFGRSDSSFPVLGVQKGLVILVEYQDTEFQYGDFDYFNRMLNEEGFSDFGSLGSARDWFVTNSEGKFLPDFDVFGPVKLPNNRSYYGGNDEYGNDLRAHDMVIHACDSLDSVIDFTDYDRDGDGRIDNVFVFYAGKGEHDSNIANAVWPHSWDISVAEPDTTFVYDGVVLDHYACTCEYPSGYHRPDGIGTFVHEFSHVLGLPDLYATDYSTAFTPGPWSVLDEGPYNNDRLTPPNYSSFEKHALGWIDMLPIEEGSVQLPDFTTTNVAYVLPTERKNEFYFFENRQQIGNDSFLPYHGMLVWRVDYSFNHWYMNTVNNTSSHQRVDLIEADNKKTASSRSGDPFPGALDVTDFTFETKPKLESWSKKELAFDIRNIAESEGGVISFDAVVRNSSGNDDNAVDGLIEDANKSKVYYDLTGRKVQNPVNGIYIVNGKKVVI